MKYIKEFRSELGKLNVFTIADAKRFFAKKKISSNYLHVLIHNLSEKGELKKISKGAYTFKNEIQLVGFAFAPFYYGLQDALSLHGLWEQETNPVVITCRKVRTGVRQFEGSNYLVKHINRKMFFGFEPFKYADFWIPVSTVEKTLIDLAYFNEPINGDLIKSFKQKIDRKKLANLLKECSKKTREKVLKLLRQN